MVRHTSPFSLCGAGRAGAGRAAGGLAPLPAPPASRPAAAAAPRRQGISPPPPPLPLLLLEPRTYAGSCPARTLGVTAARISGSRGRSAVCRPPAPSYSTLPGSASLQPLASRAPLARRRGPLARALAPHACARARAAADGVPPVLGGGDRRRSASPRSDFAAAVLACRARHPRALRTDYQGNRVNSRNDASPETVSVRTR